MKKLVLIICIFTVGVFATGCSASNAQPTQQEVTTQSVTVTPAPAASEAAASAPPTLTFNLVTSDQQLTAEQTFQAGIGDMDGDGDPDLVFANPQNNGAEVWLNDGQGQFTDTGQRLTQYGHGVALADFDGDDDLDAFIVCHQFLTPSKLYLNDGNGTLADSGLEFGDASISANAVNAIDLNGDGWQDVHIVYYDPRGIPDKVYLNDGSGHFNDSGLGLDEETIAWGDLDGDGDLDYFGKIWGSGYIVQINQDGIFTPGWQFDDPQSNVGAVALADFDADGDLDALVANGHRSAGAFPSKLFLNDGSGNFNLSDQVLNTTQGAELAVGDLDKDGDLDVFVASMDRPNEVWLNDGSGILLDSGLRLGGAGDMNGRVSLGDLDGDGDLDVVVGRFNHAAEIWWNVPVDN